MTQPKISGSQIGGGWELLGEDAVTGAPKYLDFPDIFSDAHDRYKIEVFNINGHDAADTAYLHFQTAGGIELPTGINYTSTFQTIGSSTITPGFGSAVTALPLTRLTTLPAIGNPEQILTGTFIINRVPSQPIKVLGSYYGTSIAELARIGFFATSVGLGSPQVPITGVRFTDNDGGISFTNELGVSSRIAVYGKK